MRPVFEARFVIAPRPSTRLRQSGSLVAPLSVMIIYEFSPLASPPGCVIDGVRRSPALPDGRPGTGVHLLFELPILGRFGSRSRLWDDWFCDVVEGEERVVPRKAPYLFFESLFHPIILAWITSHPISRLRLSRSVDIPV